MDLDAIKKEILDSHIKYYHSTSSSIKDEKEFKIKIMMERYDLYLKLKDIINTLSRSEHSGIIYFFEDFRDHELKMGSLSPENYFRAKIKKELDLRERWKHTSFVNMKNYNYIKPNQTKEIKEIPEDKMCTIPGCERGKYIGAEFCSYHKCKTCSKRTHAKHGVFCKECDK